MEERILARADRLANEARCLVTYPRPYTFHEEVIRAFYRKGEGRVYVLGDLRVTIKRLQAEKRVRKWAEQSHQGRVVRRTHRRSRLGQPHFVHISPITTIRSAVANSVRQTTYGVGRAGVRCCNRTVPN